MNNRKKRKKSREIEESREELDDATLSTIIIDPNGNVLKGGHLLNLNLESEPSEESVSAEESMSLEEWKRQFEDPEDPDIEIIDLGTV